MASSRSPDSVRQGGACRGRPLPGAGTAFLSVRDADKPGVVLIAAALAGLGFELVATEGTARTLRAAGLEVGEVAKVADAEEGERTVVDLIRGRRCDLVVNTPQGSRASRRLSDSRGGARRPRAVRTTTVAAPWPQYARSPTPARESALPAGAHRHRSVTATVLLGVARRELVVVNAVEHYGPYALLRLERGGLDPGTPGQFFMLEAPGRVVPRPMSLCSRRLASSASCSSRSGPVRARSPT